MMEYLGLIFLCEKIFLNKKINLEAIFYFVLSVSDTVMTIKILSDLDRLKFQIFRLGWSSGSKQ